MRLVSVCQVGKPMIVPRVHDSILIGPKVKTAARAAISFLIRAALDGPVFSRLGPRDLRFGQSWPPLPRLSAQYRAQEAQTIGINRPGAQAAQHLHI